MYRIGIDTGGTNTDVVLTDVETGRIFYTKTPTTPRELLRGINNGIDKIVKQCGISHKEIKELVYGTTIVVNMIAQKESEATALITTKGFRDVLEIGRAYRSENIYDINMEKPEPLVKRNLRFEVSERMNFMGKVLEPVNEEEVVEIVRTLKEKNIRAIAVCLMHSYANPAHEKQIKEIINREWPEVFVSVSSEIIPQFREYERTSTTVINAYMMPNMASHIMDFKNEMEINQIDANCYMMQGNAGIMTFDAALQKPVSVSESGPIAGIIAANYMSKMIGEKNIITLDMGGTSADVALIQDNVMRFTTENSVEGYPISIPTVDLSFIGAGGGSIAWCDSGGALKVGPMSAGADPGPICYGKGGTRPTVTDANLFTGRIRPEIFEENLENTLQRTETGIREQVAEPLGIETLKAAEGIIDVVNSNMIRAIKFVSVQKGYDPREFTLVAFGGAGGLHAGKLAEDLEIPKVIVPYSPGTFCALGLVLSDIKSDKVHTRLLTREQIEPEFLNKVYKNLDLEGLKELEKQDVVEDNRLLVRTCDMRYFGQAFELSVPVPHKELEDKDIEALVDSFHSLHEQAYGHCMREDPIEFVNYRVSAIGTFEKPDVRENAKTIKYSGDKGRMSGFAVFDGVEYPVEVINRDTLSEGDKIEGPAIIAEMGATTVLYPKHTAVIDELRNIVMYTNIGK
ncbi:hydantoinase/oxoprolinase family protein [Gudongella oleilytica]|uniref:hydantoinase/oxoprolinase family protein n=1 Tax=Gudongella oleilytica TaxID=1582259 RepID=UPI002A37189D|nr:hydantoinase/oxoprolinase family protein [Gudongella oleilytica]MDY0257625.1 hydantoinase/oxoprolinase family protein [Gudongella oleilytica]